MQATDLLRSQIQLSKQMTTALLTDMLDAPMTFPTAKGGNHPVWVAGHLAYSEANLVNHILLGDTNPLIDWKELFAGGSEPTADADSYPPLADLLAKWEEAHAFTLKTLDSFSNEDLDKPSANCPPERAEIIGNYGKVLAIVAIHPMMHYGQVADSRRVAGRKKLRS